MTAPKRCTWSPSTAAMRSGASSRPGWAGSTSSSPAPTTSIAPRSRPRVSRYPSSGSDSTIGVIRVEPDGTAYDATHLRTLAVVAAQLGAYLTTLRLRERDRQREERLVAAHDFQQLLAGVVSHDLRNPLAVITTVASNLLDRTSDVRQAEALRRALRNAQHAARLISDLADVTEARVSGHDLARASTERAGGAAADGDR